MKRALVFQHMDHDHPGRFLDYFAEDGIVPEPVRLFEGQEIPALAPYDFLFVLGGAQDTWQEDQHPWLVAEKQAIREWVVERAQALFRRLPRPPAAGHGAWAARWRRRRRARSASST